MQVHAGGVLAINTIENLENFLMIFLIFILECKSH